MRPMRPRMEARVPCAATPAVTGVGQALESGAGTRCSAARVWRLQAQCVV